MKYQTAPKALNPNRCASNNPSDNPYLIIIMIIIISIAIVIVIVAVLTVIIVTIIHIISIN